MQRDEIIGVSIKRRNNKIGISNLFYLLVVICKGTRKETEILTKRTVVNRSQEKQNRETFTPMYTNTSAYSIYKYLRTLWMH